MELVTRLFGEAWDHRRRRQRFLAGVALLVMAAVTAGALAGRPPSQPLGFGRYLETSSPVLSGSTVALVPDQRLGDHCSVVNSVACDAARLEIRLKRPASSVVATVAGRVMSLKATAAPRGANAGDFRPETVFTGNLNPPATSEVFAHQKTEAIPPNDVRPTYMSVRLSIDYLHGGHITTGFWSVATRCWLGAATASEICSR